MDRMATNKKATSQYKAAKHMARSVSGRFVVVDRNSQPKRNPSVSDVLREQIAQVDRAIKHADQASERIRGST